MEDAFQVIRSAIQAHPDNKVYTDQGWQPVYTAGPHAKLAIIGQAPGRKAQESQIAWNDASGDRLRQWLGIEPEVFYDPNQVALLPMDFYYPGKGKTGDKPPRKEFAKIWHPQLLDRMPAIRLIVLVGRYAQEAYLTNDSRSTLTERVRHFQDYLPDFFPIVHPSPLNGRWLNRNPWFQEEVLPALQDQVQQVLTTHSEGQW